MGRGSAGRAAQPFPGASSDPELLPHPAGRIQSSGVGLHVLLGPFQLGIFCDAQISPSPPAGIHPPKENTPGAGASVLFPIWSGLKAGKSHSHLQIHRQLVYLPHGGVFPLALFLLGEEFLLCNSLSPEEQSQAPEPSAFQPGTKQLLGAFPGLNKSIRRFVKLWQFLKRIFCLGSSRFVLCGFSPPSFHP